VRLVSLSRSWRPSSLRSGPFSYSSIDPTPLFFENPSYIARLSHRCACPSTLRMFSFSSILKLNSYFSAQIGAERPFFLLKSLFSNLFVLSLLSERGMSSIPSFGRFFFRNNFCDVTIHGGLCSPFFSDDPFMSEPYWRHYLSLEKLPPRYGPLVLYSLTPCHFPGL